MPRSAPQRRAERALPRRRGAPAARRRTFAVSSPRWRASTRQTRFTVVTTRKGADALRRDGWTEFCALLRLPCDEGAAPAPPARRAGRLLPRSRRRRGWDLLHSLASSAPVRTGTPAVITLHDVTFFHHRTFGLATTVAHAEIVARGGSPRGRARHRQRRRRATTSSRRSASTPSGSSRSSHTASAAPRRRRRCPRPRCAPHGCARGAPRRAVRRRDAPAQEPGAAGARAAAAAARTSCWSWPVIPSRTRPSSRRSPRSSAWRSGVRIAGYVDDAELGGAVAAGRRAPRSRRSREGFGLPVARGAARAAFRSRAPTSPCCARSAATRRTTSIPPTSRPPRGPSAAALEQATRRPRGERVGRSLQLGGRRPRHVRGLRASARRAPREHRRRAAIGEPRRPWCPELEVTDRTRVASAQGEGVQAVDVHLHDAGSPRPRTRLAL